MFWWSGAGSVRQGFEGVAAAGGTLDGHYVDGVLHGYSGQWRLTGGANVGILSENDLP